MISNRKFLESSRNKKTYKYNQIYYVNTKNSSVSSYLEHRNFQLVNLNENERLLTKHLDVRNHIFEYYMELSLLLARLQKDIRWKDIGSNWENKIGFIHEYEYLREKYSMSLQSCLMAINEIFSSHKFDASFIILSNLNAQFTDYFTYEVHIKNSPNNVNLQEKYKDCEIKELLLDIETMVKNALLFTVMPAKPHSQQSAFQRNQQLIGGAIANYKTVLKQVKIGIESINNMGSSANIIGFSLYFKHSKLLVKKYNIKILINEFFILVRKSLQGNDQIFYARNIAFDGLVGVQLDLLLVSNLDGLESWISQIWLECCMNMSNTAEIAYQYVFLGSKREKENINTSPHIKYTVHAYLMCIKNIFIRLNLSGIRLFSVGKLHAK